MQVLSSDSINARCRIVVLISGNGSNLQAIIDHCSNGKIPAEVVGVISNVPSAFGLERARLAGIEARCLNHREFISRAAFDVRSRPWLRISVQTWSPWLGSCAFSVPRLSINLQAA